MSEEEIAVEHSCFKCEKPVSSDDIATGNAYMRDGYYVCPDCLKGIKERAGHGEIDTLKSQLAAMTAEIRNISQHLHYEEFSWLFVVGGGLQALVLFILYRAFGAENAQFMLLQAILVQLMAITAFIVGKLK